MLTELTNHLWQSTLFAVAAGLLALVLRKNRAHVRYWIWFSASLKFLIPFALLMSLGSHFEGASAIRVAAPPAVGSAAVQIAEPFSEAAPLAPPGTDWKPAVLVALWGCGFCAIAWIRFRGWLRIRAAVRSSVPVAIDAPVDVRSAPGLLEPGVVGFLRPVLLLPQGIEERLTPPQLEAVLAHELCHVRRRDNLFASIHMIVEAAFWFHPLVWWIGARLLEERERACDEEVLTLGNEPRVYAEGILNVCKLYVESPLVCVSGVTGADLKKRVHAIMTERVAGELSFVKKIALAAAVMAVLTMPAVVGMLKAQSTPAPKPQFEVASVRMAPPPVEGGMTDSMMGGPGSKDPGQITYTNVTLKNVIGNAYGVDRMDRIFAPGWVDSQRYNIVAKIPEGTTRLQFETMLQNLLAERFQLALHRESREFPGYELAVGKKGPKLKESALKNTAMAQGVASAVFSNGGGIPLDKNGFPLLSGDGPNTASVFVNGRIRTAARGQTAAGLARWLGNQLHANVVNKTGLGGAYDFTLEFDPSSSSGPAADIASDPSPSIFAAVEDQLGLKLVSAKESAEVVVIDHLEKVPTEN